MLQKKLFKQLCVLLLTVSLFSTAFGCAGKEASIPSEPISRSGFQFNTIVTISIYDSADTSILDEAFALCENYELLFSRTDPDSELYQLNAGLLADASGVSSVSEELAKLIQAGLSYGKLSDGAFSISIAPLTSLWDFTSSSPSVPAREDIEAVLPLLGDSMISLDGQKVSFGAEGAGIDLGAIAKGWIADRLKDFLLEKGVHSAIINLGGNVLCVGEKPDGSPFKVGIQKPFATHSETIAAIEVSDWSVVSSGIYERYFEQDGHFYHHILNPATGYPYDNNLVAVTILSEKSVDGDGLSTTCFALGLDKGMELIDSLDNVYALFITDDYEIHYSEGFLERFPVSEI